MTTRKNVSVATENPDIVRDTQNASLYPKLVLCTSNSASFFLDGGSSAPEYEVFHRYLVDRFRPAFTQLTRSLMELGYEVWAEFYVDSLTDEDYELSVGAQDDEGVDASVSEFHSTANAILAGLPDALGDLLK